MLNLIHSLIQAEGIVLYNMYAKLTELKPHWYKTLLLQTKQYPKSGRKIIVYSR